MKFLHRLYDVLCDLISVKVTVMVVVTRIYLPVAPALGIIGFSMVAIGWLSVIGFRYLEKYMNIVKRIKE